ncbi:uncharacterized protein [Drosophila pseudoobscura]|uniref:Uncharacterized protein n=1 Tax=Drosophila pseudoobscura pseudoobscura TaxID=46245 RepID=A0A6I8W6C7_DROPS|nr:uncharacterized protein LOC117184598 [Drosophila pseudoobscura]
MKRLRDGRQARPLGANGDTTGHPSGDQRPEVPAPADEPTASRTRDWIVNPDGPSTSRQAQLRRVGEATLRQPGWMPWGQRAAAIQGWIDQQTHDPRTDAEGEVEPDGRFATAGVRSALNHDVAALNRLWLGSYGAAIDDDNATTDTDEHETILRNAPSLASTLPYEVSGHPVARGSEWDSPLWAEWDLAGQGRLGTPPAVRNEDESGDGAGPHYSDVSNASDAGEGTGPQRDDGGSDSRSLMDLDFAPQANQHWAPANPSGSADIPPPFFAAHAGPPPQRPDEEVRDFGSEESLPLEYGEMADLLQILRLHPTVAAVQNDPEWAEAPPEWRTNAPGRRLPRNLISNITVFLRDRAYRLGVRRLEVHDGTCFRIKITRSRAVTVTLRHPRSMEGV